MEYANKNPIRSFEELAEDLSSCSDTTSAKISKEHLVLLYREEARRSKSMREAAKDVLIRYLQQYSVKWSPKTKDINHRMGVYALWSMFVRKRNEAAAKSTWDYIEQSVSAKKNDEWMPTSVDDPLVKEAFDECWPA